MNNKTVIVTGADSGIGKATTIALARKQYHVVMVSPNPQKGKAAQDEIITLSNNKKVDFLLCDFTSQEQVRQLAAKILKQYDKIDILINNAGMLAKERVITVDGYESTFAINHLAPFLLTNLLLDRIKATPNSRIITLSSDGHQMVKKIDFDNLQAEKSFEKWHAYGLSKLCNIYFTTELAKRLKDTHVTANSVHPGVVRTNFGNTSSRLVRWIIKIFGIFLRSPEKGAETSVFLADSENVAKISGKYFYNKRIYKTTELAKDTNMAKKIWDLSEKMVGLS